MRTPWRWPEQCRNMLELKFYYFNRKLHIIFCIFVSCVRVKKISGPWLKKTSWLAEEPLDSQVGICSMEFIYGLFNLDASGRDCNALRFPLQKPIVARPVGQDVPPPYRVPDI